MSRRFHVWPGSLLRRARLIAILGFVGLAASGALLFVAEASHVVVNPVFRIKAALIGLGLVNIIGFEYFIAGKVRDLQPHAPLPFSARFAGVTSIAIWLAVAACGRLILAWDLAPDPVTWVATMLESGTPLTAASMTDDQLKATRSFCLITEKPRLIIVNIADDESRPERFIEMLQGEGPVAAVPIGLEKALAQMAAEERDAREPAERGRTDAKEHLRLHEVLRCHFTKRCAECRQSAAGLHACRPGAAVQALSFFSGPLRAWCGATQPTRQVRRSR